MLRIYRRYIEQSSPDTAANRFSLAQVGALAGYWLSLGLAGCSIAIPPLFGDADTIATTSAAKAVPAPGIGLEGDDWRRAAVAMGRALDPQGIMNPGKIVA